MSAMYECCWPQNCAVVFDALLNLRLLVDRHIFSSTTFVTNRLLAWRMCAFPVFSAVIFLWLSNSQKSCLGRGSSDSRSHSPMHLPNFFDGQHHFVVRRNEPVCYGTTSAGHKGIEADLLGYWCYIAKRVVVALFLNCGPLFTKNEQECKKKWDNLLNMAWLIN